MLFVFSVLDICTWIFLVVFFHNLLFLLFPCLLFICWLAEAEQACLSVVEKVCAIAKLQKKQLFFCYCTFPSKK